MCQATYLTLAILSAFSLYCVNIQYQNISLCAQDVRSALVTLMKVTILEVSKNSQTIDIPLYSSSVQAGFPSPADDYIEAK